MNLFIDCHIFDDGYQGTRTYLEGIYQEAISQAPSINFYLAAIDIENLKKIFGEQPNVYYLKYKCKNKFLRLGWDIPGLIRKYKIDYAHFQYITPLFKCCKEIVTIHDVLFLDFPRYFPFVYRIKNKLLFKAAAKRADLLLTVSEYSREAINRHFHIAKERIFITFNAIPEQPGDEQKEDDSILSKYNLKNYLLYVSRFEPRKNHLLLLKAFVELELFAKGYRLVLVGRKDIGCREYEAYYQMLGPEIKKCILYLSVDNRELQALYRHCKLFIFPSLAEGFGIPPLEAVVYGANTLCSNVTAMSEFGFFEDKLFNPYDLAELKKKILHFIENNDFQRIDKEKQIILQKYNWKIIARDYLYRLKCVSS